MCGVPRSLGKWVRALPTASVLRVRRRLQAPGDGRAVPDDDLRVQAVRLRRLWVADVVGAQMRRVAVRTRPLVGDVLVVAGWGEAAGFDDGGHVDGGGGIRS